MDYGHEEKNIYFLMVSGAGFGVRIKILTAFFFQNKKKEKIEKKKVMCQISM
jgi:hypothetical protein